MATKKKETKTNGITDLLKELWQAAVNLRGSIEPSDYKRYVLPIIFLRFLSLRYERTYQDLLKKVNDPNNPDYHGDKGVLDDPDEYRSARSFLIPENARWENIIKIARQDDIKIRMDDILQTIEDTYPDKLKGLLPRVYANSNMEPENLRGLINIFSKDIFKEDHKNEDLLGRMYEYFIGEFASSEGKRGGEYFTPLSIVRTLVAMLEPKQGIVFDPCCGSGGMFVQSEIFTNHSHQLSFVGQESKDFTYRLCKMNMFIHGIDGNIELGNSYWDDQHTDLKADYLLANPPFNDGSKSNGGWGANRIPNSDQRIRINSEPMALAPRNANTMWIMHFLSHLKDGGMAGFVMATGELSNGETARLTVRKALIENGYVDCIVQLSGQLFANTQIPCALWFLSKNRNGSNGYRKRNGEILFIDGRKLGALIPGSRKQKQLSEKDIEKIASKYRDFKFRKQPEKEDGFCNIALVDEIIKNNYVIAPGRYVGSEDIELDDLPFEERLQDLSTRLEQEFISSKNIEDKIRDALQVVIGNE